MVLALLLIGGVLVPSPVIEQDLDSTDTGTAWPFRLDPAPAVEPGSKGSWDSGGVWGPRVLRTAEGLKMLYVGQAEVSTFDNHLALGIASSVDGRTWTKGPANPILTADALLEGATGLEVPTVLEREGNRVRLLVTLVGPDRLPLGWREATVDLDGARIQVGKRVEMDRPPADAWNGRFPLPETFFSPPTGPRILGSGCCGERVWKIGALRFEQDRLVWQPDPVFAPGSAGAWDRGQVFGAHVSPRWGGWVMVYAGTPGTPESDEFRHTIGYALSRDGLAWSRPAGDNRLLEPLEGHLIEYPFLLAGEGGDLLFVAINPHPAQGTSSIHVARGELKR